MTQTSGYYLNAYRGNTTIKQEIETEKEALEICHNLAKQFYSLTLYKVTGNNYSIVKSQHLTHSTQSKGRYKPEVKPEVKRVKQAPAKWVMYDKKATQLIKG
jgi:hypothetical protein